MLSTPSVQVDLRAVVRAHFDRTIAVAEAFFGAEDERIAQAI